MSRYVILQQNFKLVHSTEKKNVEKNDYSCFFQTACFPMLYSVELSPAKRMHTPAPGGGSSSGSGPAPVKQCQAVHKFSNVCSGSARPGPVRALILWLSEDPALNSSCNTGKRSNWGIFYIINSGEQPSHSPSPLPLHFYSLYSHSHTFLLPNLFFTVFFLSPTSLHSLDLFSSFLSWRVRFLIH